MKQLTEKEYEDMARDARRYRGLRAIAACPSGRYDSAAKEACGKQRDLYWTHNLTKDADNFDLATDTGIAAAVAIGLEIPE